MFPLDIRTDLQLGGVWTDVSGDVYVRDPKQISRGRRDQGSAADPSSLSLTLNNRSGRYSPRNAMSPLYGQIGRNTPVRVSVPGTVSYLQLDGVRGRTASTPDAPALDITGDLDVRVDLDASWSSPLRQMVIGKWNADTDNRSWMVMLFNGAIYFQYSLDGTSAGSWYHAITLPPLPQRACLRATFDVDDGAGGRVVRAYWSTSMAGPWTQFAGDSRNTGTGSIHSSAAPLSFDPGQPAGYGNTVDGRIFRAEVRNGIGGTIVAAPDFTAQAAGATSFTDSAGRT